ncbi:hypothetical protein SAMN05216391_12518 [Lachnospiraceae bacterium KHCPX20]|nr:hypothetical protein SAMN05216391_12518 [Lachnospiraceae bacterium KHCPX20]
MFRNRIQQMMIGRNGPDALGHFTMFLVLVLFVISALTRNGLVYLLALVLLGYGYFRMMSKNTGKRYLENQKYLQIADRIRHFFGNGFPVRLWKVRAFWNEMIRKIRYGRADRKIYRYYKCPECRQKVRVPKGHGKIEITCPKCKGTFIRRS